MTTQDDNAVETQTGAAVDGLVEAVRGDMGTATDLLQRASAVFAAVANRSRGVNGLAVACNGWRGLLGGVIDEIRKEVAAVERRYNGSDAPEPITENVDHDHARKVLAARTAAPEQQQLEEA